MVEPSVSNEHYGIKPILNLVKYSEFHVETDGGNMMKHPQAETPAEVDSGYDTFVS